MTDKNEVEQKDYGMTREEFLMSLEELIVRTRPDILLDDYGVQRRIEDLEEELFGVRGRPSEDKDDRLSAYGEI